jgi:hypothetical protein
MPRVGFEPTIPVFERAKTVHALDRAATVIGKERFCDDQIKERGDVCNSMGDLRNRSILEREKLLLFVK